MENSLKTILWDQFGASIDMLENALEMCPDNLWATDTKFWYIAYHTLFYLDYYLSEDADGFSPPAPFTLTEFDLSGAMPERVYTKTELLTYHTHCKNKCRKLIAELNDENAAKRFINAYRNYSRMEIIIYNMRHVQHHAAQLYLLLRQGMNDAPKWVSRVQN